METIYIPMKSCYELPSAFDQALDKVSYGREIVIISLICVELEDGDLCAKFLVTYPPKPQVNHD